MTTLDSAPEICLLGASFNTRNMGVGALTAGTIKCIKHRYPASTIFLLDYGRKEEMYNFKLGGKEFLIELVNMRFSKKLYQSNHILCLLMLSILLKFLPEGLRSRVISSNNCLKRVNDADMVVSLAGGDSFSDIYGAGRFFYVALPQLLALFMRKRLVLMPQTLGPFKSAVTRVVARHIIKNSEAVYSRDYAGIEEMKGLLDSGPGRIRFCYDVGFVLDPEEPGETGLDRVLAASGREGSSAIGLNVSGLLAMGGYTRDNMFGLKVDYRELVKAVIGFLVSRRGAAVVLVPHVFGGPEHAESDVTASRAIYEELKDRYPGKLFMLSGTYDQHQIKHIIGRFDFFIGSRMHSCIAALSQGVPAVAIAYSRKFKGVMESLDLDGMVADPCTMDTDGIIRTIGHALDNREHIKKTLSGMMPQIQRRVLDIFSTAGV